VFDFFAWSVNINVEADLISNSFSAWDGGHAGSRFNLSSWLNWSAGSNAHQLMGSLSGWLLACQTSSTPGWSVEGLAS
jgi:hypothetical protein